MTRRLAVFGLAVLAFVPAAHAEDRPVVGDAPPPPVPEAIVQALDHYDLESRWVTFATSDRTTPRILTSWLRLLRQRKDLEMLEWVALYRDWSSGADALAALDAPSWARVAAWGFGAVSSHSFEHAATTLMRKKPAVSLAWLEAHEKSLRASLGSIYDQVHGELAKTTKARGDITGLLPPLDPLVVYRHLDAPQTFERFTPGDHGPGGGIDAPTRWRHQVIRALVGFQKSRQRPAPAVDAVRRLLSHPNAEIRKHAALSVARRGATDLPFAELLRLARDERQPRAVRRAALLAFASHDHPQITSVLHDIAVRPDHPLALDAVRHLVDLDADWFHPRLMSLWNRAPDPKRESALERQLLRLGRHIAETDRKRFRKSLPVRIGHIAWMRLERAAAAGAYQKWLAGEIRHRHAEPETLRAVRSLIETLVPASTLRAPPPLPGPGTPKAEALTATGRAVAAELLDD